MIALLIIILKYNFKIKLKKLKNLKNLKYVLNMLYLVVMKKYNFKIKYFLYFIFIKYNI